MQSLEKKESYDFADSYQSLSPRVKKYILKIVRDRSKVDDLFNEAMTIVWLKSHTFEGKSKFSTWVFTIARRCSFKELSRSKASETLAMTSVDTQVDQYSESEFEAIRVRQVLTCALSGLSDDHRTVIQMAYFQELSCAEISQRTSCPVSTVKTRMFHARKALKSALKEQGLSWSDLAKFS